MTACPPCLIQNGTFPNYARPLASRFVSRSQEEGEEEEEGEGVAEAMY